MLSRYKILLTVLALFFNCALLMAQEKKTVTGTVKDSKGTALSNATVAEKGANNSVLTDANGSFSIKVSSNATLVISYVGFKSTELSVAGQSAVSVTLEGSGQELEEVVVTSLGVTKKQRSLGYAQSTVKSEQIMKTAPTNFASALYGKAPGVRVEASPGGATSGVAIQIRGVNSINGKTTPLIIMDGVPIRDGVFKNNDYWSDQRLRANGLVDLNPEDIDNISILKGASAAALYGSEAVNGVVLITTKSGKGKKGFSVDFNANASVDNVAYLPQYQHVRATGYPVQYKVFNTDANGFVQTTVNGVSYRTLPAGSINYGPKFDGQPIMSWDGVVRPYSDQGDNYGALFQQAFNHTENIAFSNTTDNSSTRFSMTNQGTQGVSLGSDNKKVTANLNSSLKIGKKNTADILVNYIYQKVHNRPYSVDRMINNFSGMISRFDNGDWYQNKYKTSLGYKYVTGSTRSLTPAENITFGNYRTDILDYMWNVKENNVDEFENRVIASLTDTWDIAHGLKLRGRISTDHTNLETISKNTSSIPLVYGYSGSYGQSNSNYTIVYGDALLTYNYKVNQDLDLTAMAGYTANKETGYNQSVSTNGGLSAENRFDLTASYNTPYSSSGSQTSLVKDAWLGTINANYKNYLYVEGTVRRDRTSTMSPDNNSFVYPSINSGFVFSDAFKMPSWMNYGKLRASWGIVGNYPAQYAANVAYAPGNLGVQSSGTGSVLTTTTRISPYGNMSIKPEQKNEWEIGLETRLFKNRLTLDASYYDARIVDQILSLSLPITSGASSILSNVGTLHNSGIEVGLTGTAVQTKDFNWDITVNWAMNKNKVEQLAAGATELIHADYDGNAAQLKSVVGQPMGDLYAHPLLTDAKGNNVIGSDGLYLLDANKMVKYGNAMPKGVGGIINSFRWKTLSLDAVMDYKYGGYVMPTGINWMTSRGLTEESTKYMDKASGGITYYLDAAGKGVATNNATGPNGEKVYEDGMLLPGVTSAGAANTYVISQAYYYWNVYNWGGPQYSSSEYFRYIVKNDYLKMRELSLTYTLPTKIAQKLKSKKMQLSVFGRNLFYIYRSIKDIDSEQLNAGSYWSQNVNNAGTNPSTKSVGVMLRASF